MPDIFWAAFGGGLGGGIAVVLIEVFRRFADRPLIRCEISPGFMIQLFTKDNTRYIFLEAANPHAKPVTLSTFGLLFKSEEWGKLYLTPQGDCNLPHQLDEGKSFTQWSTMQQLLKTLKEDNRVPKDLKWVYFEASSGKLYRNKIPKWVIKELEKEFSKMNGS